MRLLAKITAVVLAISAAMVAGADRGWTAAGPWAENDHGRLRLISATAALGPPAAEDREAEGTLALGLQFQLLPGWKIYWRSPGDAGFPPSLDWSGSENLASAQLSWPAPHRFSLFGLETFGYGDEVVLPVAIEPLRRDQGVALRARVDYLTCNEICIPYSEDVSLTLPAGPAGSSPEAFLIEHFADQVPQQGGGAGLEIREAKLLGSNQAPEIFVRVHSDLPFVAPDIIVEGPPGISYGRPAVELGGEAKEAEFRVSATLAAFDGVLEGKMLTLTVLDGKRGLESEVLARFDEAAAVVPPAPAPAVPGGLLAILGLALLGGLILNLMPCVLPVLSLKLLSLLKQGGRARRQVRVSFLATAAGVVFSFLVLATAAVAVKAAGMAVGWGIQFQQPLFLAFMALVVSLFACNLFGFFEILLPAGLSTRAAQGSGQGVSGSFATGAFATLLATPCSAPFLGTAVGFALARGAAEIYLIFFMLGLGLSLPYLVVAAAPGVAQLLPRPGRWMVQLRRLLGLALVGTAVWLLTVLAAQVGVALAVVTGVLLGLLGFALWARGRVGAGSRVRAASPAAAAVLALAVLLLPLATPEGANRGGGGDEAWAELDLRAIAQHVAAGRTVFVDVTADWCLTCQVNKKLVLDNDPVAEHLAGGDIVLQRGDWTSPDEEIGDYLASFGRYGIPFNAVYGPAAPQGLALPEILSVEAVMEALEQAGGS